MKEILTNNIEEPEETISPGEIPEGWARAALEQVAYVRLGKTPGGKTIETMAFIASSNSEIL